MPFTILVNGEVEEFESREAAVEHVLSLKYTTAIVDWPGDQVLDSRVFAPAPADLVEEWDELKRRKAILDRILGAD